MRSFVLAAAGAAVLVIPAAEAASPSRSMLAGSEVRRNVSLDPWRRYEVLKLNTDGTFSGNYESRRPTTRGKGEIRQGPVSGRWSIEAGNLCFEGSGLEYPSKSCYRLTRGGASARQYSGTHTRTGDVWQFFIYPRGS